MIWDRLNKLQDSFYRIVIKNIEPSMGLPGGQVSIRGKNFKAWDIKSTNLHFVNSKASLLGVSNDMILTSIPANTISGDVYIELNGQKSNNYHFAVPKALAGGLHMIDNPVVGSDGSIYATYSGGMGKATPISVYRINKDKSKEVYLTGITNPTSLLIDGSDLYIASRFDGKIYKSKEKNKYEVFSQGLGVAFGLAMNSKKELYVGDRGGSIFKVNEDGKASFFTSVPQSYIAFHLSFDSFDNLYVSNPIHMGENFIYKINMETGRPEVYYKSISLFHGFVIDKDGYFYLTETKRSESRIIKIKDGKYISTVLTGTNFIGLAFDAKDNLIVATAMFLYVIENGSY